MRIKLFRVGAQKGYCCGGATAGDVTTVVSDKIVFATATTAAQASADLSTFNGRFGSAGLSDKEKGFICGGYRSGSGGRNVIDKVTYPTDTAALMGITLSTNKYLCGGMCAGTKGYVSGGATSIGVPPYKAGVVGTEVLTYSTEAIAAAGTADLGTGRWGVQGLNGGGTKGYFAGGTTDDTSTTGAFTLADKITFSNDTRSAQVSANLSSARFGPSGLSEGRTKGYFVGGSTGSWSQQRTVDVVTFATDVTAVNALELCNERTFATAVSEGLSCGYIFETADWNVPLLLVFATDVNSVVATAALSVDRYGGGALSQSAI
jgi:hypothetical protein